MITALIIFIITYLFIGLRQIPRLHIDRPAGALVGAVLMVIFGVLTLDQAFSAIDMHTLLLLGMMIITVYLRTAGFFELMADKMLSSAKSPLQLLILVVLSSGLLSALFVNDTICLLYTPIILEVTIQLGVNPMPYLLALAMSSTLAGNLTLIGSVANLIVVKQARKRVEIGFVEYFRVGALITAVTIAIGIAVLAVEVRLAGSAEAIAAEKPKQQSSVTITPADHRSGPRTFNIVLICDTEEARTRGLQGFRQLRTDEAALFVFEKPEVLIFWMGSVAYPIDIAFVSPDKKVVRVYPDCRPGSRDTYTSGEQAAWVIETSAGSGIRVGDRVRIEGFRGQGPGAR
ncbi:MAG: SLC13 family permease [Nitrospirae bacterium]|nr:SLC13 family permease [Nitrospirota bacterium]